MNENSKILKENNILSFSGDENKNTKSKKKKIIENFKFIRKINTNKETIEKKERNPGIDFLRILGMYAIVVHHVIHFGKVLSKYSHYRQVSLINILCFFHICVYGLISGIIGHKTHKYSNLLYLWFCTFFYSVSILLIYKEYNPIIMKKFTFFFPVIYNKYWYFTQYFGMYLFLPLINQGLSLVNKSQLKIIVLSIIFIFVIWRDFMSSKGDPFLVNSGHSIIGLLLFYITGAYLGKYVIKTDKKIFFYLIYLIVYFCSSYLCYYLAFYNGHYANFILITILKKFFTLRINSLAMILQGISITLFFSQIKYNKYLGKIFTFIGPLTFGVYLIHSHELIYQNEFEKLFQKYPKNLPLHSLIIFILLKGFIILFVCLIIDYFRYLLFTILQIRKICIIIEKIINRIIG